jgi:hypothetical protein
MEFYLYKFQKLKEKDLSNDDDTLEIRREDI